MIPVDVCTRIMVPCSSTRTSIVLNAGTIREPARAKGQEDVARNIFNAVTATGDTRYTQCHAEIADILAFRPKLRRNGLKRSVKRKITYSSGTGFLRSKRSGLMMICSLFRKLKGTEEIARQSFEMDWSIQMNLVWYGVFP